MYKSILPLFLALLLPNFVFLSPVPDSSDALVITSPVLNENPEKEILDTGEVLPPELKSMHVDCNVTNRYAHTVVSSRYKNPANKAQEATFSIILPNTAFIAAFSMEIKDKVYHAYVKEKEEAKREYNKAIASGLGAGYVENARDSNVFAVSVNLEPLSEVTFNLSYEELLIRKHGKYEMVINLHPGQQVKDLAVDVNINETQKLVNVKTPAFRSVYKILEDTENSDNEYAVITPVGEDNKAVHIHFAPTVVQQKEMAKKLITSKKNNDKNLPYIVDDYKINSLPGQFVIEYDVERSSRGGEILVNNGYFVHFFAPPELKPMPKHAVFVLDVSGSMMKGGKYRQLKEAMNVILDELKPNDYFNLVEFSYGAKVWNLDDLALRPLLDGNLAPPAFPATPENKQKAKNIIKNMRIWGATNIYEALRVSLQLTNAGVPKNANATHAPQPIVIFLTDGEANEGETNPDVILKNVNELNENDNTAIFFLDLGFDANNDILKKLALQNSGFMRQIYEASDAALQLQDFYKQITSPLLANVSFKYPEGEVEAVTQNKFHTLFDGGEFVVSGKMENIKEKMLYVHGLSFDGPINYPPVVIDIPDKIDVGPIERLWAYMTIKQLLNKKHELSGAGENSAQLDDLNKQALKLALKYSFVTPVTSLGVVKPNETEKATNVEEAGMQALPFPSPKKNITLTSGSGKGRGWTAAELSDREGRGGGDGDGRGGGYGGGGYVGSMYEYVMTRIRARAQPTIDVVKPVEKIDEAVVASTTEVPSHLESQLQWISALKSDPDHITIDNKSYNIGINDNVPCIVDSLKLNGTCTLLSACPKIYPKLVSYETYFNEYFCKLEPSFAGVCCVDVTTP